MAKSVPKKNPVPSAAPQTNWTPAGGGQMVRPGVTPSAGVTAGPPKQQSDAWGPAPKKEATPSGGGDQGGTTDPFAYDRESAAAAKRDRALNAIEAMRGVMEQYGLGSLMTKIQQYVTNGYTDPDAIMALIRTTPEYEQRFPAMKELAKKGRGISEAEYISYETEAAGMERMYGLPSGMITSKDTITKLLTGAVSGKELEERVTMAAAGAFQTSPEVKKQFKDYYGIDSGGLTAYFLDPEVATPLLTKRYVSAQLGAEAAMQGIDVGMTLAEQLNVAGVTKDEARIGFGAVAGEAGLMAGAGDVVSQEQLIQANLLGDQTAKAAKERAAGGKLGKFQGGGEFLTTQGGAVGLGTAATG